jgi:hypothetical protein
MRTSHRKNGQGGDKVQLPVHLGKVKFVTDGAVIPIVPQVRSPMKLVSSPASGMEKNRISPRRDIVTVGGRFPQLHPEHTAACNS